MASHFSTSTPDEPAPSYEESVLSSPSVPVEVSKHPSGQHPHQQPHLPLPSQLANTRTQRVEDILSTYVDPLLVSQGAAGLYKTTFILIPSSVSALQDAVSNAYTTPQEPQVVGFPSDEVVKLVRLKGEEHAMEFWRQPAVVAELGSSMKSRLAATGHKVYDPATAGANEGNTTGYSAATATNKGAGKEPEKAKRSFWGRKSRRDPDEDVVVDRKLGWRAEELPAEGSGKLPTGMVKVAVVWQDVTLRIANEMGLYESKRGPGLCISVEVGT